MSEPAVLLEVSGHIAIVTLNRPDNRNSMTDEVLSALQQVVDAIKADRDLRSVVITGKGRSFCAGADFKSNAQRGDAALQPNERSFAMYQPFLALLDIEVPIIGALNGHAIGGGMGLALVCDIRVANRDAKYGVNFVRLGIHPGMAATYLLPRIVGMPRAAELLFTGRLISGQEAADAGLMNHAVPETEVLPKAMALAEEIAANAPVAVRWTKRSLYENADWRPRAAAWAEAALQSRTLEMKDAAEGIGALLEKRAPRFRGE